MRNWEYNVEAIQGYPISFFFFFFFGGGGPIPFLNLPYFCGDRVVIPNP